ncbi:MAG: trypsin-like peptidase domain-containing protein [Parcubacteria group bacterium]|nr:trypsin-like peptidase domain-containing protein [Parcubacteria group bacterium]
MLRGLVAAIFFALLGGCGNTPFQHIEETYSKDHVLSEAVKGYLSISGFGYVGLPIFAGYWAGSAFVIDADGTALTVAHNIWYVHATEINAETHIGETYQVDIVGFKKEADIGVIRVAPYRDMRPLPIGDPNALKIGDMLYGICTKMGTPTVFGPLLEKGVDDYYTDLKVTLKNLMVFDGDTQPQGCSGGPVITENGKVVGVITGMPTETLLTVEGGVVKQHYVQRGSEIYFVPIDQALAVARRIIEESRR